MLLKKIAFKRLLKSVEHISRYLEEGEWGEPRITIVCGENGMIELPSRVMEALENPEYIEIEFSSNSLVIITEGTKTFPIKVTRVGSKGIIQNPELVLAIARKLNLSAQEGILHQMYMDCFLAPSRAYFHPVIPRRALEEIQVVDSFDIKNCDEGKKLSCKGTLTIDSTLGLIKLSSEVYRALNEPEWLEFGVSKGYLVINNDERLGLGGDVQIIGDEVMIQCECLADRITGKFGQEDREGGSFRMAMVECRKFRKVDYAFFALVREVSH